MDLQHFTLYTGQLWKKIIVKRISSKLLVKKKQKENNLHQGGGVMTPLEYWSASDLGNGESMKILILQQRIRKM